ncbi:hypothetical protein CLTEP_27090 [Clostridium tepidiprofundi DSM 19306]|uniref:DUF3139 domain-containing protein n=1 Tax=Clostridium tepidiprofundi DSM 19306 TaxID=1121338 RepID=A0A151APZ5_9CLOT|nr:hypothetical protein [Clostridium tepidiprofundi]KYH29716.1 hypothetical protein CLTEP_27090 [Clostridium tepidiprofundi DSM 19306]
MDKKFTSLLALIVILGVIVLGLFMKINQLQKFLDRTNYIGRYEFYKANDINMVILDTATGRMWMKYISHTGGNREWTEETKLLHLIEMERQ